ncbi:Glyoxalase/Bleomycin resistance protein/Dihydroxybiphenyl dioxygenase [Xylariaceae sp. FL0016]|nr:Glyoxalase/Bleomycin resistance protein/Dihydroxybiphenyl dioxygenase [Xylariaceae sp. FL0016]
MSSSSSPIVTPKFLDHLVLTVSDLDRTLSFYTSLLHMRHHTFAASSSQKDEPPRHALAFGNAKINLHIAGREFEPRAASARPGTADLCFLVAEPVDDVLTRLRGRGIEVLEGGRVVQRAGARGPLQSVYVRDPDGNLIE